MASLTAEQLAEKLEKSEAGRKKLRQAISMLQEKVSATEKLLKVNENLRQECEQERQRAENEKQKAEEEKRLRSLLEKDASSMKDQLAKVMQRIGALESKQRNEKKEFECMRKEVKISIEGVRAAAAAVDAMQNSFQNLEKNLLAKINGALCEPHLGSEELKSVKASVNNLEANAMKKVNVAFSEARNALEAVKSLRISLQSLEKNGNKEGLDEIKFLKLSVQNLEKSGIKEAVEDIKSLKMSIQCLEKNGIKEALADIKSLKMSVQYLQQHGLKEALAADSKVNATTTKTKHMSERLVDDIRHMFKKERRSHQRIEDQLAALKALLGSGRTDVLTVCKEEEKAPKSKKKKKFKKKKKKDTISSPSEGNKNQIIEYPKKRKSNDDEEMKNPVTMKRQRNQHNSPVKAGNVRSQVKGVKVHARLSNNQALANMESKVPIVGNDVVDYSMPSMKTRKQIKLQPKSCEVPVTRNLINITSKHGCIGNKNTSSQIRGVNKNAIVQVDCVKQSDVIEEELERGDLGNGVDDCHDTKDDEDYDVDLSDSDQLDPEDELWLKETVLLSPNLPEIHSPVHDISFPSWGDSNCMAGSGVSHPNTVLNHGVRVELSTVVASGMVGNKDCDFERRVDSNTEVKGNGGQDEQGEFVIPVGLKSNEDTGSGQCKESMSKQTTAGEHQLDEMYERTVEGEHQRHKMYEQTIEEEHQRHEMYEQTIEEEYQRHEMYEQTMEGEHQHEVVHEPKSDNNMLMKPLKDSKMVSTFVSGPSIQTHSIITDSCPLVSTGNNFAEGSLQMSCDSGAPSEVCVVCFLQTFDIENIGVKVTLTAACVIGLELKKYLLLVHTGKEAKTAHKRLLEKRISEDVPIKYLACSFASAIVTVVKKDCCLSKDDALSTLLQVFVSFIQSVFKEKADSIFDAVFTQLRNFLKEGKLTLMTLNACTCVNEDALSIAKTMNEKSDISYECSEASLEDVYAGSKVLAALCQVLSCVSHLQYVVYELLGWCDKDTVWLLTVFSSFASIYGQTAFLVDTDDLLGHTICAIIAELVTTVQEETLIDHDHESVSSSTFFPGNLLEPLIYMLEALGSVQLSLVIPKIIGVLQHILKSENFRIHTKAVCESKEEFEAKDLEKQNLRRWQRKYAEIISALELVSQYMGWDWTYNHLIMKYLWKMVVPGSPQIHVAAILNIITALSSDSGEYLPGLIELRRGMGHAFQYTSFLTAKQQFLDLISTSS